MSDVTARSLQLWLNLHTACAAAAHSLDQVVALPDTCAKKLCPPLSPNNRHQPDQVANSSELAQELLQSLLYLCQRAQSASQVSDLSGNTPIPEALVFLGTPRVNSRPLHLQTCCGHVDGASARHLCPPHQDTVADSDGPGSHKLDRVLQRVPPDSCMTQC